MRGRVLLPIACAAVCVCLAACVPDAANTTVSLPPPYNALPPAPAGAPIEAVTAVVLDARQQEAVVAGVVKWLKDPGSAQFGAMAGARNSGGAITVCGEVSGRNSAGAVVGMAPFVGVLMGTPVRLDFVLVGLAASAQERAEVTSLCRESGIARAG